MDSLPLWSGSGCGNELIPVSADRVTGIGYFNSNNQSFVSLGDVTLKGIAKSLLPGERPNFGVDLALG